MMVAEMVTMVDMLFHRDHPNATSVDDGNLICLRPSSVMGAIWRGTGGRCPRCGCTRLFKRFLKPVSRCVACGEDWNARSSDDFPPYIVILVLGHIIAPGMIGLETMVHPPLWVHLVIWLPLVAILGAAFIQPAKGGVMALQWWLADGSDQASEAAHNPEGASASTPEPSSSELRGC
ncbi:DUF983 domain-containing protein [Sphingosinicella rhizophila]|uniref:DUF983 domain-containing protein n=1 Tax=Sphingosinicella rhizophila TaxID=3050082 RepID=A0ABU3QCY6_9SPHN|nr:DUF983 domain-containing protein [Sphingosinicella sp. GR2756]MDT9600853.1 DUF983 domain-containing protein [Sphingosinicella sp. GR2756]